MDDFSSYEQYDGYTESVFETLVSFQEGEVFLFGIIGLRFVHKSKKEWGFLCLKTIGKTMLPQKGLNDQ